METVTEIPPQYTELPQINLFTQLNNNVEKYVDTTAENIYKDIIKILSDFSERGYKKIIIFISKKDKNTDAKYDYRLDNYYEILLKEDICKMLTKKFRSAGIKILIDPCIDHIRDGNGFYITRQEYGETIYPIETTGHIMKCKWNHDYSKKKSCIII